MNTNVYDSKLLREREGYNEWAKWIYFQLQEKHPDASRIMVWEEKLPEKEVIVKRMMEATNISKMCMEALDDEEAKIKDPELFKMHLLKIERRGRTRGMVTSAIGFIQQRISSECLQLIKHKEASYNKAIDDYDLYSFWDAIAKAMKPKEMVLAMRTATLLAEISSMKQEGDETVNEYIARFSKKMDELSNTEGITIKQSVLSCMYVNGLNESFTSFKNHIQNLKEADMDFMKTREASLRWTTTEGINGTVLVASSPHKGPMKQKGYMITKSNIRKPNTGKRACYICKETTHLFKDCPKFKAIAAGATTTNDNNGNINNKDDIIDINSYHST